MELILTSIVAFASTNIDDIFILMLFFGNKAYKPKDVIIGQYLGVSSLIVISLIGSLAGLLIDARFIGILGLFPIFLGAKSLLNYFRDDKTKTTRNLNVTTQKASSVFAVAAITFANGGDNIAIYIPLFATLSAKGKFIMICIFLLMIAVWCIIGKYLSRHPAIARIIDKYGHLVTPVVLILLGIYILYESGVFSLLSFYEFS